MLAVGIVGGLGALALILVGVAVIAYAMDSRDGL
jgi:hypothetical protein